MTFQTLRAHGAYKSVTGDKSSSKQQVGRQALPSELLLCVMAPNMDMKLLQVFTMNPGEAAEILKRKDNNLVSNDALVTASLK